MRDPVDQGAIDCAASRALGHRDACHLVYLLIVRDVSIGDWFTTRVRHHLRNGDPQTEAYEEAFVSMLNAHGSAAREIAQKIQKDPDCVVDELRRTIESWESELA
jgi:hypothetical protein